MHKADYTFSYEVYESIEALREEDAFLLREARMATQKAYAPYSRFRVGAAARVFNGGLVIGSNQENASFPVGLCAERVVLASASTLYPGIQLLSFAVSYQNQNGKSNRPVFPCGVCRQSLQEYEHRFNHPIRLIIGGMEGSICVVPQASYLLPFAFSGEAFEAKIS